MYQYRPNMRPRSTFRDRRYFVSPGKNSTAYRGRASYYPYPSYNINNSFPNQYNYDSPNHAYTDYGENFISFESYQEFDNRSFQLRNIPEDPYARNNRRQWANQISCRRRSTDLSNSTSNSSNSAPSAEAHIENKHNDTSVDKLHKNEEKARQEFPSRSPTSYNKIVQSIYLKNIPCLPNDRMNTEKSMKDNLNAKPSAGSEINSLAPAPEQSAKCIINSANSSSNCNTPIKREEDDMSVSSTATIEGPDANRTEEEFEKFVACKGKIEGEDRLPGHYVNIALYLKDIPEKGMDIEEWAHSARTSTPLPHDNHVNLGVTNVLKTPKTPNDARNVLNGGERSVNIKEISARGSHSISRSCKRQDAQETTKKELLDVTGRNDEQSRIQGKEAKVDEHRGRSGSTKTRWGPLFDRSKSYDLKSEKIKMGIKDINRESPKNRHESHKSTFKPKNYEDKYKKNSKDTKKENEKTRQSHVDKLFDTVLENTEKNRERRTSRDNKYESKSTRTVEYDAHQNKRKNEECSKQHKKVFISSKGESIKRGSELKCKEKNSHNTDEIRTTNLDQKVSKKNDGQTSTCNKSNLTVAKPCLNKMTNGVHVSKPEVTNLNIKESQVKHKLESRISSHMTKANSDNVNHIGSNNDLKSSKTINIERCEKKRKVMNKNKEVPSEKGADHSQRAVPNKETVLKGDMTLHKNRGSDKSACNKNDSPAQQEIYPKIKIVPMLTHSRDTHNTTKDRDNSNLKRDAKVALPDHKISGRIEEALQKDVSRDIDSNTDKSQSADHIACHISSKSEAVNVHDENATKVRHNHDAKINCDADNSFTESECNMKLSTFQTSTCESDESKAKENSKEHTIIKAENLEILDTITKCKEFVSIIDKPAQVKGKIHNDEKSEMNNGNNIETQRELSANNNSNSIPFSLDSITYTTSTVEILKETTEQKNMENPPKSVIRHTKFVGSDDSSIADSNNPTNLNAELPDNIMPITQKISDFNINMNQKGVDLLQPSFISQQNENTMQVCPKMGCDVFSKTIISNKNDDTMPHNSNRTPHPLWPTLSAQNANSSINCASSYIFNSQNEKIRDVAKNSSGIQPSYIPNVKANNNFKSEVVSPIKNANERILNSLNEHKTFTSFIVHVRNIYEDLFNYQRNVLLARQSSFYDIEMYILDSDFSLMKKSREHRMINEFVRLIKISNLDMRIMCDNLFIHHVYCRLLSMWRTNWRCPSETDIKGLLEALYTKAQKEISLFTPLMGCDNMPYKDDLLMGNNVVYHKEGNDATKLHAATDTSYNASIPILDINPMDDGNTPNDKLLRQMLASPPRNPNGYKKAFEEATTPIIKQSSQDTLGIKIGSVVSLYDACNAQNKKTGSVKLELCPAEVVSQNMPEIPVVEIIDLTRSPESSQIKSSPPSVSNDENNKEHCSSLDASRPKSNDSGFMEEVSFLNKSNARADVEEQKLANMDQENPAMDDEDERRVIYCMLCNDVAELRCSRCHWACYCSVICQEKHWDTVHMFACKSPKQKTS